MQNTITEHFYRIFNTSPTLIVRAPGRVNLIGEHTDYNDGFVLPLAINRAVWIALRPRTDTRILIHSLDFPDPADFDLTQITRADDDWVEYVKGIAWVLQQEGHIIHGWEGVMAGDIPVGAGLSSSAGLELAIARAFASISGLAWHPAQMALLSQKAENQWVGVNCGIMDQMISAAGKKDHALLIDCRSLDSRLVPLPAGTAVVVLDTATRRGLVDSAYNERRAQCETAARHFGVPALRDVTLEEFTARADELEPVVRARARHVISENARTLEAVTAMENGDPVPLGELMDASHVSLRDDFQVSSEALNIIVKIARAQDRCYGARMTGAGFGGCAVALVKAEEAEAFAAQVAADYEAKTGRKPNVYVCSAEDGAEVILENTMLVNRKGELMSNNTLFEAIGGSARIFRLAQAWHERVLADDVVAHAFSHGFHPQHTERLAAYWGEAWGGPPVYSERYGSEASVVRMHSGNGQHEEMDRRAIACFDQAMEDIELTDPALRRVLHDYFAWATTTTMAAYPDNTDGIPDGLKIPRWSWDGMQR